MAGVRVSRARPHQRTLLPALPLTNAPRRLRRANGPRARLTADDIAQLIAHPLFDQLFAEAINQSARASSRHGGESR